MATVCVRGEVEPSIGVSTGCPAVGEVDHKKDAPRNWRRVDFGGVDTWRYTVATRMTHFEPALRKANYRHNNYIRTLTPTQALVKVLRTARRLALEVGAGARQKTRGTKNVVALAPKNGVSATI
jgi:hypothetical protein